MYSAANELKLLLPDISDRITDYCGIQLDVEDTRIKASCLIAQDLDIAFVITDTNWQRCFSDDTNYSEELFDLMVPVVCFFTYARLVALMQGSYSDSGMAVEEGALSINEAKAASKQYRAIGESYLGKVVTWLEDEDSSTEATMEKSVLRVRSYGGQERPSPDSGNTGWLIWPDRASSSY